MSIETTIVCDSCSCLIIAARTAGDAREQMREQGLGRTRGRRDQCAWCVDEERPMDMGGYE